MFFFTTILLELLTSSLHKQQDILLMQLNVWADTF